MKTLHAYLTSTLDGGKWLASRPGRFNLGVRCRSGRGSEKKNSLGHLNLIIHCPNLELLFAVLFNDAV